MQLGRGIRPITMTLDELLYESRKVGLDDFAKPPDHRSIEIGQIPQEQQRDARVCAKGRLKIDDVAESADDARVHRRCRFSERLQLTNQVRFAQLKRGDPVAKASGGPQHRLPGLSSENALSFGATFLARIANGEETWSEANVSG
jgi:hypothetical protein